MFLLKARKQLRKLSQQLSSKKARAKLEVQRVRASVLPCRTLRRSLCSSDALAHPRLRSNNWNKARIRLARLHQDITNKRRNWFWELSHKLCDTYDVMCFETLKLKGMQRLWGKKIGDLAFGSFLEILQTVAATKGKSVVFVGQWFASSKL